MLTSSISKNSLLLGLFAVISTAIIAGTFLSTTERISENIRKAEEKALIEIVPKSRHNNSMIDNIQSINNTELLGLRESKKLYVAQQDNNTVAIIIPATARDGYTGDIDIIIGINIDGSVAGVRVLSHRETPGLGDAIEKKKSNWVDSFTGKSLLNPKIENWTVKKDGGVFDQFTGATITPRAVSKAVAKALLYFQKNKESIMKAAITEGTTND